jgi:hypothetical protein
VVGGEFGYLNLEYHYAQSFFGPSDVKSFGAFIPRPEVGQ